MDLDNSKHLNCMFVNLQASFYLTTALVQITKLIESPHSLFPCLLPSILLPATYHQIKLCLPGGLKYMAKFRKSHHSTRISTLGSFTGMIMCQSIMAILQHSPHTVMRFPITEFLQTSRLRRTHIKEINKEVIWVKKIMPCNFYFIS